MTTITGQRKKREPKWYETPIGKIRLKFIVIASKMPLIGKTVKAKYYNLPGVGNAKNPR
jgi:hypothetical protein